MNKQEVVYGIRKNTQIRQRRQACKKTNIGEIEAKDQAAYFKPATDVFENENDIRLSLDMPGVKKDGVQIMLEKGILSVSGNINTTDYENYKPLYTEYNVDHYTRRFEIPDAIDQDKIEATLKDGVLTLTLPKAEAAKPRKIEVK